jgi:O-antigen/teichoic acid export membrane protein
MVTAFNMTCNLGLNYVLLQHFGTIGAAMAFAITMFLVMGLAFLICNRLHPMPWLLSIRRAAS